MKLRLLSLLWVVLFLGSYSAEAQSDFCATATSLAACTPQAGNNIGATFNSATDDSYAAADICAASVENTVWYTFTAPAADTYTISFNGMSCNLGFGAQTGVLTGPCGGPYTSLNCAYIADGTNGSYTVALAAGQQIFLVIDGDGGDECTWTVDICGTVCNADAGTYVATDNGVVTTGPIYLCADGTDCIALTSNNDFVLPTAQPGEIAELFWALYTCAPTGPDPAVDPCFSGSYWTAQDFADCNPSTYGLTGQYFFVPLTADDGDNGGDPNGVIHHDQNGDGCFDLGTPIEVYYLNDITFGTPAENCYNGTVTIQVNGGSPEFIGGNYTITNTGSGAVAAYNVSHGQSVTITGLTNGDSYSFTVTDPQGCTQTFTGGPYTACACPVIDFTGLPANMTCEDAAVNLFADQTGFPTGAAITPCYYVQVFPTNAQAGNQINILENGTNIGCFGPGACTGGAIGAGLNFSGYISYASPSANNQVELCETTVGVNMTYAIFDCHSGALITSGNWISDGACQTVSVTPPGSLDGLSSFSGTGITTTDWGAGVFDPTVSGPGTFTVTYNWDNENGCSGTAQQVVTVSNPHDAAFTYPQSAYCANDPNPSPNVTGDAGGAFTSSPVGLTLNGSSGLITLGSSTPGVYEVYYTSPGTAPCNDVDTFSITVNAVQTAAITYTPGTLCPSDAPVTPVLTGAGGGTYTSSPGGLTLDGVSGQVTPGTSTPNTYTVTYTTPGPCAGTTTASVTINPDDDPAFAYGAASYCESDPDPTPIITGDAGGIFSATPAGLSLNPGTGAISISGSTIGSSGTTYDITYTTPGPCVQTLTVQVTLLPDEDPSFSYAQDTFCVNGVDPLPIITGTGGGSFSSAAGLTLNGTSGLITLNSSSPGTYTVTYTTPGQCSTSSTFDITIEALDDPAFAYGQTQYCSFEPNPTPTITGDAGGTFSATPAGLTIDPNTGLITIGTSTIGNGTTYDVTYTTAGPCPQMSTQQVTLLPQDTATYTYNSSTYCLTGSDPTPVITGTTGGTFTGSGSLVINGGTGTIDLSASGIGVFTVTYITAGTCPDTLATLITITNAPDATFNFSNPYCEGDPNLASPTFGAGASAGTFSYTVVSGGPNLGINPGTGDVDLTISDPGTYNVTNDISAQGGCAAASSTSQIIVSPQDSAGFTYPASLCLGDLTATPTITGATNGAFSGAGVTFNDVNTGEIDLVATGAGTYTVQYLTGGTCPDSLSVSITITANDVAAFSYAQAQYCQDEVDPLANITGTAGGVFTATPAGLTIDPNTGLIDLGLSAANTYTIEYVTSTGSCADSTTVTVTIDSVDNPAFSYSNTVYCAVDPDQAPTITGTTGGTFASSDPLNLIVDPNTGLVSVAGSQPGSYTITYTTGGACPDSATVTFDITTQLDATIASAGPFCSADAAVTLTAADAGGTWSGPGITDANAGTFDPGTALNSGPGPYTVTYTLPGSCGDVDTEIIVVDESFDATISAAGPFCEGDPAVNLSAVDNNGVWTGAQITDVNLGTFDPSVAGVHQVIYTINTTCGDADTINIVVNAAPAAPVGAGNDICDGDPAPTLSAVGGGGTFTWYSDAAGTNQVGTGANYTPSVNGPGTYTYYVQETLSGCSGPLTAVTFTVHGPTAFFVPNPASGQAPLSVYFDNQSTNGSVYSWDFGDGSPLDGSFDPTYVYTQFGDYIVSLTVSDNFGCSDTYSYSFIDVDAESAIMMPNVFSPNADGQNDVFRPRGSNLKSVQGQIFNRWGEKLFEWDAVMGGWDGRMVSGNVAPDGTYYYVVKALGADEQEYEFSGHVTLVR